MRESTRPTQRRVMQTTVTLALCAPTWALAHGGHADVGALAHPLAHASFFLAAVFIAAPALVHLGRRAWRARS